MISSLVINLIKNIRFIREKSSISKHKSRQKKQALYNGNPKDFQVEILSKKDKIYIWLNDC